MAPPSLPSSSSAPQPDGPRRPVPPAGAATPSRYGRGRRTRRGLSWPKRVLLLVVVLVAVVLASAAGLFWWAGGQLRQMDALAGYPGRPTAGKGTNWLLVGSDSRRDLTAEERRRLRVGGDAGLHTDTVLLLHHGAGEPSLVSLPRDSYVRVPGHGKDKINVAYALGGAELLTRTVEQATGLRVEQYAEVDFLGVVRVVDALGGVRLCSERPLRDEKSGADLPAGCGRRNGTQALAYVRARYGDPEGDLGRVRRERALVGAVADAALGPGVLLNPFRLVPVADAALAAVRVDERTGVVDLARSVLAAKKVADGAGRTATVPITGPGRDVGGVGEVLEWDQEEARRLFRAVRADEPIPTSANK